MSDPTKPAWNLHRLHIFATVAKAGSLKAAAYQLAMPQPSVSRQIARLEDECNGRLFERTGRGMKLTELGERILVQVERILAESEALTDQIVASGGLPFGDVRIGILPSLSLSLALPLFFEVKERFPGIRLQFFEGSAGQIDQWLLSGHLDIGLPYRYGASDPSAGESLIRVDSCLIGPAGDAVTQYTTVPFVRLDGLPLVLPSAPSGIRHTLDRLARKHDISLNIVIEADSTQLQASITAHGGTYTVLPRFAVTSGLRSGQLQAADIVEPTIERNIVLAMTSAHTLSYAARSVVKILRRIARNSEEIRTHAT